MILKIDEWNIKTIAQVVYMCSAVTVAYAALEAAKALRSIVLLTLSVAVIFFIFRFFIKLIKPAQ